MLYNPHDYQRYATEFILSHPIAAVILQMGLGKTVCTLDAINQLMYDSFEVSKILVIAPLRVAKVTWSDEIKKWDNLSHLRYSVAVGTEKERIEALKKDADIYIINRENVQWLVEKSKVPFEFDMVVIDELSSFKNWNSKRFKAFMQVRPRVKRIVGLTGTPSPNGMMDLFAQFKWLEMGARLGRFITQYRNKYFVPDRMNGQIVYSYRLRPGAEKQIYDKIDDITISMKAMDHLKMPELIETRYPVYMDEDEQAQYDEMREDYLLPYMEEAITAANAAALSGKLCQMANGAIYSDSGEAVHIHDRKLEALEDIIEAAQGPILLCYWFKHDLERITEKLDQLKVSYSRIVTEGYLEPEIFHIEKNQLVLEADELAKEKELIFKSINGDLTHLEEAKKLLRFASGKNEIKSFDDDMFLEYVDTITVKSREEIVFNLKCGLHLIERLVEE